MVSPHLRQDAPSGYQCQWLAGKQVGGCDIFACLFMPINWQLRRWPLDELPTVSMTQIKCFRSLSRLWEIQWETRHIGKLCKAFCIQNTNERRHLLCLLSSERKLARELSWFECLNHRVGAQVKQNKCEPTCAPRGGYMKITARCRDPARLLALLLEQLLLLLLLR